MDGHLGKRVRGIQRAFSFIQAIGTQEFTGDHRGRARNRVPFCLLRAEASRYTIDDDAINKDLVAFVPDCVDNSNLLVVAFLREIDD